MSWLSSLISLMFLEILENSHHTRSDQVRWSMALVSTTRWIFFLPPSIVPSYQHTFTTHSLIHIFNSHSLIPSPLHYYIHSSTHLLKMLSYCFFNLSVNTHTAFRTAKHNCIKQLNDLCILRYRHFRFNVPQNCFTFLKFWQTVITKCFTKLVRTRNKTLSLLAIGWTLNCQL